MFAVRTCQYSYLLDLFTLMLSSYNVSMLCDIIIHFILRYSSTVQIVHEVTSFTAWTCLEPPSQQQQLYSGIHNV